MVNLSFVNHMFENMLKVCNAKNIKIMEWVSCFSERRKQEITNENKSCHINHVTTYQS